MKKALLFFLAFISITGGIIGCLYMMSRSQQKENKGNVENFDIADKVTDECIDEYDEIETESIKEANSEEKEKLSPNAILRFDKFFKGCEHTVSRYEEIDKSLVNFTKDDIQKKYSSWIIKEFSNNQVVLYQEAEGECGEHYMLRDVDGKINIYKLDEKGNESLINETEIATEYLTETDMIDMDNGLIVYGKESLNKLLEDLE